MARIQLYSVKMELLVVSLPSPMGALFGKTPSRLLTAGYGDPLKLMPPPLHITRMALGLAGIKNLLASDAMVDIRRTLLEIPRGC